MGCSKRLPLRDVLENTSAARRQFLRSFAEVKAKTWLCQVRGMLAKTLPHRTPGLPHFERRTVVKCSSKEQN